MLNNTTLKIHGGRYSTSLRILLCGKKKLFSFLSHRWHLWPCCLSFYRWRLDSRRTLPWYEVYLFRLLHCPVCFSFSTIGEDKTNPSYGISQEQVFYWLKEQMQHTFSSKSQQVSKKLQNTRLSVTGTSFAPSFSHHQTKKNVACMWTLNVWHQFMLYHIFHS